MKKTTYASKSQNDVSIGEVVHILLNIKFRIEIVENIINNLPPAVPVNVPQFQFIKSVFDYSMDMVFKHTELLRLTPEDEQTRQKFLNRKLFEFKEDNIYPGCLFDMKIIITKIVKSFQLPDKLVSDLYTSIKKNHKKEYTDVEKVMKAFNVFFEELEKNKFGIEIVLFGNVLKYKESHVILTEKESLLIIKLIENGGTVGKKLKEIDRDEANLQKTKNTLNKKIKKGFNLEVDLIPSGGYFINNIFKITIKP